MFNSDSTYGDEERLRRLMQKLSRNQTDIIRLRGRIGQSPDGIGANANGPAAPVVAYTPAQAPTTTVAPTTTTTTTPAPAVAYLYPVVDFSYGSDWNLSSGTDRWALLSDQDAWPDHATYLSLSESKHGDLVFWIDGLSQFSSMISVILELYCKNAINTDLISFTGQILGDDGVTPLTDTVSITGVGSGESSFNLRTATFTLEPEAQEWWQWTRPTLILDVETDNDAGSPEFYLSAARVKPTFIPSF